MSDLDQNSAVFFANQLRSARLAALADAESFDEIIHAIERLGSYLDGTLSSLGGYAPILKKIAKKSELSELPDEFRNLFTPFGDLYDWITNARNDALHQGAFARHLTEKTIILAIILEDAVRGTMKHKVSDLMVTNPTLAELWQPVGFIRQQMLANSYSYLPVHGIDRVWCTVSDVSIARFLGLERTGTTRKSRLAIPLQEVPELMEPATVILPDTEVSAALVMMKSNNVLLVVNSNKGEILGILTAFDLL
jgi:CBS domain-containing protein